MMLFIRSSFFNILMALWTLLITTLFIPTLLTFNTKIISAIGTVWSTVVLFMLKTICGINYRIIGADKLPPEPCIIASKHQSMWETVFLINHFNRPVFILKKELTWIPFYGWFLVWMGMISIARSAGTAALKQIIKQAHHAFEKHRSLIIFPEGTRVDYGQRGKIQAGIIAIHNAFPEIPIVLVSVDSGRFWKKGSWLRLPGTITVEFAPVINQGKQQKDVLIEKIAAGINYSSR